MRAPTRTRATAFTLIELLLVMVVILILVGIVIALAGPAQTRAARARASAEIEALRNGLERYKVDNAVYPSDQQTTEKLNPAASTQDGNAYSAATRFLYAELTGQTGSNSPAFPPTPPTGSKIYFEFKPTMLGGKNSSGNFPSGVSAVNDPWGQSYGYSTAHSVDSSLGYNPTYDLWSLAGKTTNPQTAWIKNW